MDTKEKAFVLTPMSQKISLSPGESYIGWVMVANPSDATEDFSFKARIVPFGVASEEYDAVFKENSARTQVVEWMELQEQSGTLAPNEVAYVHFKITVPETAPAGAQFGAIVISGDTDKESKGGLSVENVFEMASVLYVNIEGDIYREGIILENIIPRFSADSIVPVETRVENRGNTYEDVTIRIRAEDAMTGEVYLMGDEENGTYAEVVMPETTRRISRNIDGLPMVGVVQIEQWVEFNGLESYASEKVIICPVWFIGLVVVVIGVIIGTIVGLIKRRRKRKIVI